MIRADIDANETAAQVAIESVPPIGVEAANVPLYLARDWLSSENPGDVQDAGGDAPQDSDQFGKKTRGSAEARRRAWRYRDGEAERIHHADDLRPSDFLVVPATTDWPFLDRLLTGVSFNAQEDTPWILDQFETAYLTARDRLLIRFHKPARDYLNDSLPSDELKARFQELTSSLFASYEQGEDSGFDATAWKDAIPDTAKFLAEHLPEGHCRKEVWQIAARRPPHDWVVAPYDEHLAGAILKNRSRVGFTKWPLEPERLGRQTDIATERIPLDQHNRAVACRAKENGTGLPEVLVRTLSDAGLWHDLGKLDPRFQAMLHGCSLYALGSRQPVAKSYDGHRLPNVARFYRSQAELPYGFRHELLSMLIVAHAESLQEHPERDLLLHLIASHHGRCRALAPVVHDPDPQPVECQIGEDFVGFPGADCPLAHMEEGVARRFWSLTRRFGWWGLPYLEVLLRLADQKESATLATRDWPSEAV